MLRAHLRADAGGSAHAVQEKAAVAQTCAPNDTLRGRGTVGMRYVS